MLREKHDRGFVFVRVLLNQIFHGFEQQSLTLNVPRVLNALFAFAAAGIGKNRNRENFCHYTHLTGLLCSMPLAQRLLQSSREIFTSKLLNHSAF